MDKKVEFLPWDLRQSQWVGSCYGFLQRALPLISEDTGVCLAVIDDATGCPRLRGASVGDVVLGKLIQSLTLAETNGTALQRKKGSVLLSTNFTHRVGGAVRVPGLIFSITGFSLGPLNEAFCLGWLVSEGELDPVTAEEELVHTEPVQRQYNKLKKAGLCEPPQVVTRPNLQLVKNR